MAFRFTWPIFSADFLDRATLQLESALNGGTKPAQIVGRISVKELHLGTQPPDLEMLEIGELLEDKFRGMFKLTYSGDAYLVLQMSVQANPLPLAKQERSVPQRSTILAANKPLVVPMQLSISNLKLRGVAALVVDKAKGATLTFKNDPLERVDVSSTFDNVANIRRFLQNEIERQLRKLFTEDLPALIHNLSLYKFAPQPGPQQANTQRWHQADGTYEVTFGADGVPIVPAGSYQAASFSGGGRIDNRSVVSLDSGYYSEPASGLQSADQSRYPYLPPLARSISTPLTPPGAAHSFARTTKWFGNEPWEAALRGNGDHGLSIESDWSRQEVVLAKGLAEMWKASKLGSAYPGRRSSAVSSHVSVPGVYSQYLSRANSEGVSAAYAAANAVGLRVALPEDNVGRKSFAVWRRQLNLHNFQDDMSLYSRRSPPSSVYSGHVHRRGQSQPSLSISGPYSYAPAMPSPLSATPRGNFSSTPSLLSPRVTPRDYFDIPTSNEFDFFPPSETRRRSDDDGVSFPPVLEAKSISAQQMALLLTANHTISPVVRPTPSNVAFRTHPRPAGSSTASLGPLSPGLGFAGSPRKAEKKVHRFRMPAKQVQGIGLVPAGAPRRSNGNSKQSSSASLVSDTESVRSRESRESGRSSKTRESEGPKATTKSAPTGTTVWRAAQPELVVR